MQLYLRQAGCGFLHTARQCRIYRGMGMFDIILFAAAAAFLAYRVYMVLGQKRHDETQRPNPFQRREEQAKPPHKRDDAAEDSPDLSPLALPGNLDLDGEAPPKPFAKLDAAPGSLAGTLAQIGRAHV